MAIQNSGVGRFVWENHIAASGVEVTDASYGTDVFNALSASKLVNPHPSDMAMWYFGSESPDTQRVVVEFDCQSSQSFNFYAIMGFDWYDSDGDGIGDTPNGRVKFKVSSSSAHSGDRFDSGWSTMTKRTDGFPNKFVWPEDTNVTGRYCSAEFECIVGASTSMNRRWMKLGSLWMGGGPLDDQFKMLSEGYQQTVIDTSRSQMSRGGSHFSTPGTKIRQITQHISFKGKNDLFSDAQDESMDYLDRTLGQTGYGLIFPFTESRTEATLYGRVDVGPNVCVEGGSNPVFKKRLIFTETH